MTREEVKHILLNTAWLGTNENRERTEKAVEIAVKALEAKDKVILIIESHKGCQTQINNVLSKIEKEVKELI